MLGMSFRDARPTPAHMALVALHEGAFIQHVISQNVDGLHLRSGLPASSLCELHGNVFRERCSRCEQNYLRGFDVTERSAYHKHKTTRTCESRDCGAPLRDTIVYFGEKVGENDLEVLPLLLPPATRHPPPRFSRRAGRSSTLRKSGPRGVPRLLAESAAAL